MSYDMQKGESEREGEMSGRGICPGKYVWIPMPHGYKVHSSDGLGTDLR